MTHYTMSFYNLHLFKNNSILYGISVAPNHSGLLLFCTNEMEFADSKSNTNVGGRGHEKIFFLCKQPSWRVSNQQAGLSWGGADHPDNLCLWCSPSPGGSPDGSAGWWWGGGGLRPVEVFPVVIWRAASGARSLTARLCREVQLTRDSVV